MLSRTNMNSPPLYRWLLPEWQQTLHCLNDHLSSIIDHSIVFSVINCLLSLSSRLGSVQIYCSGISSEKKSFQMRQTLLLGGAHFYQTIYTLHISISRIMETEQSWDKLRYSQILIRNQIINFKSATELLNLMASKNFTISHFLKICIEDNLLPYPRFNSTLFPFPKLND